MWGWKPSFWEGLLIILLVVVSTIICFPCFLLQTVGFKAKRFSNFLQLTGLEDLSYFPIKVYCI